MCGIWCSISSATECWICNGAQAEVFKSQQAFLSRRGPDFVDNQCVKLKGCIPTTTISSNNPGPSNLWLHTVSNILWTQGEDMYGQPYINADGSKLMLFNGDIYSFSGSLEDPDYYRLEVGARTRENDGKVFFDRLVAASTNEAEMCIQLGNVQGPFAFIFVDKTRELVWFARDFFGRESLLFSHNDLQGSAPVTWNISSVSTFAHVFEIPTSGLICLNLKSQELQIFHYSHIRENVSDQEQDFVSAVIASGLVTKFRHVSPNGPIIQVHFSTQLKISSVEATPTENETLKSLIDLAGVINSPEEYIKRCAVQLSDIIDQFLARLKLSITRRVTILPPYCKSCLKTRHTLNDKPCIHPKVGVLFSGGLDSTVLAYLAAEALPEGSTLDLINVAFSKDDNFNNVPDRETAIVSYKMLDSAFKAKGKIINLVLVDVRRPEVEETRRSRIRHLISPLKSVLDDSLGVCLWFAARGTGYLYGDIGIPYSSPIRVVLLGSGADELLGGYSRHRSAFQNSGWLGLASEMQLEIDRISIRNLGRDNRIVSDHGICPRMPFLDENVVDFLLRECDLWVKCCPANVGPLGSRGSGEKLLLRATAAKLFGDEYLSLALFPKRAMQFGSRIAKLESSKEKGGDSCQRLY